MTDKPKHRLRRNLDFYRNCHNLIHSQEMNAMTIHGMKEQTTFIIVCTNAKYVNI
jgi:hypothetical protein